MKKRMKPENLILVMVFVLLAGPLFAANVWGAVISTVPGNNAMYADVNSTISVNFSEEMNPSTITTDTFYVMTGSGYKYNTIPGSVTYSGTTATFKPTSPLYYDKGYTAIVTKAVKSQGGIPLTADYEWSFTTIEQGMTTFVESVNPNNSALNVDTKAVITVSFSRNMDPASINSGTFYIMPEIGFGFTGTPISGTISYSAKTATFTPSPALDEMETYSALVTDGVKDENGSSMNTYKWSFTTGSASTVTYPTVISTSPVGNATDVNTDAVITATFSEIMNASTITESTFLVNDGSVNIPGTVAYTSTTAKFTPSSALDKGKNYTATVTTGVKDLDGSSLQADHVWSFSTVSGPAPTPPTVDSSVPASSATDVGTDTDIKAVFSEPVDPLTVTAATFLVNDGSVDIAGSVTYTDSTATFTPSSVLERGKTYKVTVTTGVKDLEGTPMTTDYTWSFETIPVSGFFVESTTPDDNATDTDLNADIVVSFSKDVDPSSINENTFYVVPAPGGTLSSSGATATFSPGSALESDKTYTATVTTGAKDLDGNYLQTDHTWSFTTRGGVVSPNPFVDSTVPADKDVDVSVTGKITVTFSEPMNPSTITTATFYAGTMSGSTLSIISGQVTYSGVTATFTPGSALEYGKTYTAVVTTDAEDTDGNPLQGKHEWSFATATTGAGSISGTVYGTNGNPLTGVSITVWATTGTPCGPFDMIKSANINPSSGTYSMSDLPTGTYYLRTSNNGTAYLNEWWASGASTGDCSGAGGIVLSGTNPSASGNDFQLDSEATISGTVYRNDGVTPFTGDFVRISAVSGNPCGVWEQIGDDYTDSSDGTYTVHWLPAGDYYLRTWLLGNFEWWTATGSVTDCSKAQKLTISAGESLTDKDFQFEALVTKGDINGDSNVGLPDAVLVLKVLAGLRPGGIYLSAAVNDDGKLGMEEVIYILRKAVGAN